MTITALPATLAPLALTGPWRLVAGILLGAAFGFIVVKSELAWRRTLIDQLFLRDSRFIRTFLVSIAVGSLLFWLCRKYGLAHDHFRPATVCIWGAAVGGLVTAFGLALCGQVPETVVAAIASGRIYAGWAFLGMLLAMPAVHFVSGWMERTVYRWPAPFNCPDQLDGLFSGNAGFWFAGLALILCLFFQFFEVSDDGGAED